MKAAAPNEAAPNEAAPNEAVVRDRPVFGEVQRRLLHVVGVVRVGAVLQPGGDEDEGQFTALWHAMFAAPLEDVEEEEEAVEYDEY